MKKKVMKRAAGIFLCAVLIIAALQLKECGSRKSSDPETMNVALFPYVPDIESFEAAIQKNWQEIHPQTALNFICWDCYENDPGKDLDVFVFDAIFLSHYIDAGYLLPIPQEKLEHAEDFLPFAMEGLSRDGVVYALPQLLCTQILYTRKEDTALSEADSLADLYDVIGDREEKTEIYGENEGLLVDMTSGIMTISMYLDALCDISREYSTYETLPDPDDISDEALEAVRQLVRIGGIEQLQYDTGDEYYLRAQWFADGKGRAYIDYTEAMSVMPEMADDVVLRPFSFVEDENIPLMYCDGAGILSSIEEDRKDLAIDLLNIITNSQVMEEAIAANDSPQYLLPARFSVYESLAAQFPVCSRLEEIASDPDNRVYRIGKDAREYLSEAKTVLPDLLFEESFAP